MSNRLSTLKLLIILFLVNNSSFAQINLEKAKLIFGFKCISNETNNQVSCDVIIYSNDSILKRFSFWDTNSSQFELPLGAIYNCCFVKPGYSTKCLQFDLNKNITEKALSLSSEFYFKGAKIYLIKISDLPNSIQSELSFSKPLAIISFNTEKGNFDYDRDYTQNIKGSIEKTIKKVGLLNSNPDLRKNFTDLSDTIKRKNDSLIAKELILIKKNEELYLEKLNLLEKQSINEKLEKDKIIKEAQLKEEKANSISKQKQLDLANQLRIIQEQKAKELMLLQQIEREQFLNQKKSQEAEINEQKIIALSKQK